MPEEKIDVFLPQNALSTDKNGNIFVIYPQGPDMPEIKHEFTGVRYGKISLPVSKIIKNVKKSDVFIMHQMLTKIFKCF